MRPKSEKDFAAALFFIVVGGLFAWGSLRYEFGSSVRPGPGYFPFGLGVLLALLGAALLFKSLTLETPGRDPIGAIAWRPLAVVVATIVLFALLLPRLGLPLTVWVCVAAVSYASVEARWRAAVVSGGVMAAFCSLVFIVGLKLPLSLTPAPLARWGF